MGETNRDEIEFQHRFMEKGLSFRRDIAGDVQEGKFLTLGETDCQESRADETIKEVVVQIWKRTFAH